MEMVQVKQKSLLIIWHAENAALIITNHVYSMETEIDTHILTF